MTRCASCGPDAIVLERRPVEQTSWPPLATLARALRVAYACGADMAMIAGRPLDDRDRIEQFGAWLIGHGAPPAEATSDG